MKVEWTEGSINWFKTLVVLTALTLLGLTVLCGQAAYAGGFGVKIGGGGSGGAKISGESSGGIVTGSGGSGATTAGEASAKAEVDVKVEVDEDNPGTEVEENKENEAATNEAAINKEAINSEGNEGVSINNESGVGTGAGASMEINVQSLATDTDINKQVEAFCTRIRAMKEISAQVRTRLEAQLREELRAIYGAHESLTPVNARARTQANIEACIRAAMRADYSAEDAAKIAAGVQGAVLSGVDVATAEQVALEGIAGGRTAAEIRAELETRARLAAGNK
ncbi:MAG: hypothetical protein HPY71_00305 [Firmicutes bacterium]|nr:hypothetical protein [Bacillota bacterium]